MELDVEFKPPPPGPLPNVYEATPGDDTAVYAEFYKDLATEEDRVKIGFRGDQTVVLDELVEPRHQNRWPQLWTAYSQGQTLSENGTPLSEVKWIERETVGRLNALQVYTVEHLASLNDSAIEQAGPLIGLGNLRTRAQKHLERTARAMGIDQTLAANAQLANQVQQLQQQMAQLLEQQPKREQPAGNDVGPKGLPKPRRKTVN